MPDVETARTVLSKLWRGEDGVRFAYQTDPFLPSEYPDCPVSTVNDRYLDKSKALAEQLFYIEKRNVGWDDYVPALIPHTIQGMVASAFGCEIRFLENDPPWTRPLIADPDDIHRLTKPSLHNGYVKEALELTKYLVRCAGAEYPIQSTEINGPMAVASQILPFEEFLVAMYTHPKQVHMLLDMITDLTIEFSHAQRALCPDFVSSLLAGAWGPDSDGITIADDLLAVVSPDLYQEFGVPYNNRLADAFGGIMIHSCGDIAKNMDNILRHHNLMAVNFQVTENPDPKALVDAFGSDVLLILSPGLNEQTRFACNREYARYVLGCMGDHTRVLLMVGRSVGQGVEDREESVEDLRACATMLEQAARDINGRPS